MSQILRLLAKTFGKDSANFCSIIIHYLFRFDILDIQSTFRESNWKPIPLKRSYFARLLLFPLSFLYMILSFFIHSSNSEGIRSASNKDNTPFLLTKSLHSLKFAAIHHPPHNYQDFSCSRRHPHRTPQRIVLLKERNSFKQFHPIFPQLTPSMKPPSVSSHFTVVFNISNPAVALHFLTALKLIRTAGSRRLLFLFTWTMRLVLYLFLAFVRPFLCPFPSAFVVLFLIVSFVVCLFGIFSTTCLWTFEGANP